MSRSDQAVLAAAVVVVCLVVALSLRGTRPGAPARIGAIVAGIAVILTLMVGMRANELTNPRSDDDQAPQALRPRTAQAYGGAVLDGDPQAGLTVRPPADGTTVGGAYLSDSEFCDGRLDANVHIDPSATRATEDPASHVDPSATRATEDPASHVDPSATRATEDPDSHVDPDASRTTEDPDSHVDPDASRTTSQDANTVATVPTASAGLTLDVRATSDPAAPAALSVQYLPSEGEARLIAADGSTVATLASSASDPVIRVEITGSKASAWFDGQRLTDGAVPISGGCGAVRFGSWGGDAELRDLVIHPAA